MSTHGNPDSSCAACLADSSLPFRIPTDYVLLTKPCANVTLLEKISRDTKFGGIRRENPLFGTGRVFGRNTYPAMTV